MYLIDWTICKTCNHGYCSACLCCLLCISIGIWVAGRKQCLQCHWSQCARRRPMWTNLGFSLVLHFASARFKHLHCIVLWIFSKAMDIANTFGYNCLLPVLLFRQGDSRRPDCGQYCCVCYRTLLQLCSQNHWWATLGTALCWCHSACARKYR